MAESQQTETTGNGHEPLGVRVRLVILGATALVVLIGLTMWTMGGLLRLLSWDASVEEREAPMEASARTVGLGLNQAAQWQVLETEQKEWLSEFAWLDGAEQTARIPIDRAMEIMAEYGIGALPISSDEAAAVRTQDPRDIAEEDDR